VRFAVIGLGSKALPLNQPVNSKFGLEYTPALVIMLDVHSKHFPGNFIHIKGLQESANFN
jgi:hypothetical protein